MIAEHFMYEGAKELNFQAILLMNFDDEVI